MNRIDELVTHQNNNIIHCPRFVNLQMKIRSFIVTRVLCFCQIHQQQFFNYPTVQITYGYNVCKTFAIG